MEHYVPLHPQVVEAIQPLLKERKDDEVVFQHGSFWMWVNGRKFLCRGLRGTSCSATYGKFTEQHGDVIGWDPSNRAYILTHGVSGVDWTHYKHPLPDSVYGVYLKYWTGVSFKT